MNYGMPFIRYNLKDIAKTINRTCECGRGLPLLDKVSGRTSDMIVANDGSLIHEEYFTHLLYGIPNIKKFQLIQKKNRNIIIELECDSKLEKKQLDFIKNKIIDAVQYDDARLNIVNKINIPSSDKLQFTVSEINHS